MTNYSVIIPCAGSGSRFASDLPKQYYPLLGKTVLDWTLNVFQQIAVISHIYVITQSSDIYIHAYANKYSKLTILKIGGSTRAETVSNALDYLQLAADSWVLVHDAARCCIQVKDIMNLIKSVKDLSSGGILASRSVDTLKQTDGFNNIVKTIDRSRVYHAQTPQMFRAAELAAALRLCQQQQLVVTDEASALEVAGKTVAIIENGSHNLKITHPLDLKLAATILSHLS